MYEPTGFALLPKQPPYAVLVPNAQGVSAALYRTHNSLRAPPGNGPTTDPGVEIWNPAVEQPDHQNDRVGSGSRVQPLHYSHMADGLTTLLPKKGAKTTTQGHEIRGPAKNPSVALPCTKDRTTSPGVLPPCSRMRSFQSNLTTHT